MRGISFFFCLLIMGYLVQAQPVDDDKWSIQFFGIQDVVYPMRNKIEQTPSQASFVVRPVDNKLKRSISPGVGFSKLISAIPTRNGRAYLAVDFGFYQDIADHTIPYIGIRNAYRQHFFNPFYGEIEVGIGLSTEYPIVYGVNHEVYLTSFEGARILIPISLGFGLGAVMFDHSVTLKYKIQGNISNLFLGGFFQALETTDGFNHFYPSSFSQLSLNVDL